MGQPPFWQYRWLECSLAGSVAFCAAAALWRDRHSGEMRRAMHRGMRSVPLLHRTRMMLPRVIARIARRCVARALRSCAKQRAPRPARIDRQGKEWADMHVRVPVIAMFEEVRRSLLVHPSPTLRPTRAAASTAVLIRRFCMACRAAHPHSCSSTSYRW